MTAGELRRSSVSAEEAAEFVGLVRRFARDEVAPRVAGYDRDEHLPRDILDRMGALGLMGGTVPEELGGAGLDHVVFAQLIEEISRVDHILGVIMSMPSALVGAGLARFGTAEQQARWLAPLAQGAIFGGAGITEPRSGSDVAGTATRYRRDGDGYVLTGVKAWISNLDIASFFITFATNDPALGRAGITAFVVPADAPGVSRTPYGDKLGFRPICTGDLVFDEVRLGPDALLGREGDGFRVAMAAVETGRLSVAARAVGIAQACLDHSVAYAKARVVFGQSVASFQMTRAKIADMATGIQAARLLVRACAEKLDGGERARTEASMAKMFASDVAQRVATEAVQIFGANGVSGDSPVARLYRDAKVFQIVEGTNEIHRGIIADALIGDRVRR